MELGHGRQGQTKWGGVKWEINLHVRDKDKVVCLSDAKCSYPPKEGPSLTVEGWHHTLERSKPELTANAHVSPLNFLTMT